MPTEEKISKNLRECPRFNSCNMPKCPLDLEAYKRVYLKSEDLCPFSIKKKRKYQKGITTLMPYHLLRFVPKLNFKMLNKRSLKQWHTLHKKNATE